MSKQTQSSGLSKQLSLKQLLIIVAGLILFFYCFWPYILKMPVPDESSYLYEGWRTAQGQWPYVDYFDFVWPGTFIFVALLTKVTGFSLVAIRLVALLAVATNIGITLYMGRRYLPTLGLGLLGGFLFFLLIPSRLALYHHPLSSWFGMVSVGLMFIGIEKLIDSNDKSVRWWMIASGFLAGLTFITTQSLGFILCVALGFYYWGFLWLKKKQALGSSFKAAFGQFGILALIPVFAVMGAYYAIGHFDKLWYATFEWLLQGNYSETSSTWFYLDGFMKLRSFGPHMFRSLHYFMTVFTISVQGALPVLGLLWPVERYIRLYLTHKKDMFQVIDWRLLLIFVSAVAFMAATLSYPNTGLIAYHGYFPHLLGFIAVYFLIRKTVVPKKVFVGLTAVYLLIHLGFHVVQAQPMYEKEKVISHGTVEHELFAVGLSPDEIGAMNALVKVLHEATPEHDSIFVYNNTPELYILSDRHNPTGYQLLMKLYNADHQVMEAVSDVREAVPQFIIYDQLDDLNFKLDYRFVKHRDYPYEMREFEQFLAERYQLYAQIRMPSSFRTFFVFVLRQGVGGVQQ